MEQYKQQKQKTGAAYQYAKKQLNKKGGVKNLKNVKTHSTTYLFDHGNQTFMIEISKNMEGQKDFIRETMPY